MNQPTSLQIGVNQSGVLQMVRNAFTHRTSFIGELLQNARRANASSITMELFGPENDLTLTISDDGCGIQDWQDLITVCDSSWDAVTTEIDKPFGIGFMAALCAATHVCVESNGARLACATESLLAGNPVSLSPDADHPHGTQIMLTGIDQRHDMLVAAISQTVRGFDVPTKLNGHWLDRPDALSEDGFINTTVGAVRCCNTGARPSFYLQGLPISVPNTDRRGFMRYSHVVHLNSKQVDARMPDRDVVIDAPYWAKQIQEAVKIALNDWLVEEKGRCSASDFVGYFRLMRECDCLHLLDDVPSLPIELLTPLARRKHAVLEDNRDEVPGRFFFRGRLVTHGGASLDELNHYPIWVSQADYFAVADIEPEGMLDPEVTPEQLYLAEMGGLVIQTADLSKEHWVHKRLTALGNYAVETLPEGVHRTTTLRDNFGEWDALLCDAIQLNGAAGPVRVSDWVLRDPNTGKWLVTARPDEDAWKAMTSFWDGAEERFDDAHFATFHAVMSTRVRSLISGDMSHVIAMALRESGTSGLSEMQGTSYQVHFDTQGKIEVESLG